MLLAPAATVPLEPATRRWPLSSSQTMPQLHKYSYLQSGQRLVEGALGLTGWLLPSASSLQLCFAHSSTAAAAQSSMRNWAVELWLEACFLFASVVPDPPVASPLVARAWSCLLYLSLAQLLMAADGC